MTNESLVVLGKLSYNLTTIELAGNKNVTTEGVAELRKGCPLLVNVALADWYVGNQSTACLPPHRAIALALTVPSPLLSAPR